MYTKSIAIEPPMATPYLFDLIGNGTGEPSKPLEVDVKYWNVRLISHSEITRNVIEFLERDISLTHTILNLVGAR